MGLKGSHDRTRKESGGIRDEERNPGQQRNPEGIRDNDPFPYPPIPLRSLIRLKVVVCSDERIPGEGHAAIEND